MTNLQPFPFVCKAILWLTVISQCATAFTQVSRPDLHPALSTQQSQPKPYYLSVLQASSYPNNDVCTIQILMSDTGGGHRASANALRDAFDILYPGKIECDIVDLYVEYGNVWPYTDYPALYKFGANFRECLNRPSGSTNKRADMVLSVHPLCQDVPLKALTNLDTSGASRDPNDRTTPFVTVVTDLGGAHPTWFSPKVDKCFVPSDALNKCARHRGLQPSQIVQYGLPIRKGFWSTESLPAAKAPKNSEKSKETLRAELDLDANLPTVLVVGGGDGMGGIVKIASSLGKKLGSGSSSPAYQMVVVCGSNEEAKSELSSIDYGTGVKVQVTGFVNNMDEWMRASDALVTKAGPGTIAEASICGLPCMLFAYLPGQEEGNVPFVENAGFGKYSGDPNVIADTVCSWLASPETLNSLQNAALKAARPQATIDIAKDVAAIVFEAKEKQSNRELVKVRSR